MKKILISIIVLIVIFSATYFIQQKLLNKDTTATTTGEAISSTAETIPKFNRPEVDDGTSLPKNNNINYNNNIPKAGNTEFNVDYKISAGQKPNVSGCVGKTYTPKITPNGGNVVGPFSYPVQFTFTGSVDDNLKINGRIVDAGKGVQSGSPCSHRHDLTYTADFPANTPIRIELVDQHGGEVAIRGTISVKKVEDKRKKYTLEIRKGSDSTDPVWDGIDKGKVVGITGKKQEFVEGTKVKVKAIPNKDSRFLKWSLVKNTAGIGAGTVDCFSEDWRKFFTECTVNMIEDVIIAPYFMLTNDYRVLESCFPEEAGNKSPLLMPLSVETRIIAQWDELMFSGRLSEKEKNKLRKEMIDTCKIYSK